MNVRLRMCGRLGPGDDARVHAMAKLIGDVEPVLEHPDASVWGTSACSLTPGGIAAWAPAPLPAHLPDDQRSLASRHDAGSLDPRTRTVHGGISGAVPLYADLGAGEAVHLSTTVEPLARTRDVDGLRPDWDAWAHIIASGAPLAGRSTFEGIRRMPPWGRLSVISGGTPEISADGWPWPEVASTPDASLDPVRDALAARVTELAGLGPLTPLLSGGWDSRILSALATRATGGDVTGWTTSSDTGHVLEELVASKVASALGLDHVIVSPRWDELANDMEHFAEVVDHQTSFHFWLVPLSRRLRGTPGTVLDGLGGGIFVGGAFPDGRPGRATAESRFRRLTHYLDAADAVLHPRVAAQVRERTRAEFEQVARPFLDHPFGATFTVYLTRTLPGISLAPLGLLAAGSPVATPFLNDDAVRAALAIPAEAHAGGRLYPDLLRPLAPDLADLPTAADLAPAHRIHRRRISSVEAGRRFRELVTREPVRALLAPGLADADLDTWRRLLDRTKPQHLLRGLALLALWLEHYDDLLGSPGADPLLEAVA